MGAAAEQSSSAGLLVSDQLQLRDGGVEVVFGCETKETGEIYNQEADGILGLGNSEVSLVNQVCGPKLLQKVFLFLKEALWCIRQLVDGHVRKSQRSSQSEHYQNADFPAISVRHLSTP